MRVEKGFSIEKAEPVCPHCLKETPQVKCEYDKTFRRAICNYCKEVFSARFTHYSVAGGYWDTSLTETGEKE